MITMTTANSTNVNPFRIRHCSATHRLSPFVCTDARRTNVWKVTTRRRTLSIGEVSGHRGCDSFASTKTNRSGRVGCQIQQGKDRYVQRVFGDGKTNDRMAADLAGVIPGNIRTIVRPGITLGPTLPA